MFDVDGILQHILRSVFDQIQFWYFSTVMFSALILHHTIADACNPTLFLILFVVISIVLLQFILPRVAHAECILVCIPK